MASQSDQTASQCLDALNCGDRSALGRLFPLVYDELRALAAAMMQEERSDHTLQPTALVHEAYLRLVDYERMDWKNKAHFFAVAAQAIRRVLIDHARKRNAQKRGAGDRRRDAAKTLVTIAEPFDASRSIDVIELNDLLDRLATLHDRQSRVVEMRFFGGLTLEEVAHVLDVSRTTICDDWAVARAWLLAELAEEMRL